MAFTKEQQKIWDAARYKSNKEESLRKSKEWRDANRDYVRARQKAYDAKRKEKVRERNAARYLKNRDKILSQTKAYFRTENGKASVKAAGFRRRKYGKVSLDTIKDVRNGYPRFCSYCLAKASTIDHVVPLTLGGTHDFDNLVPACLSCNSSKGSKSLLQWLNRSSSS